VQRGQLGDRRRIGPPGRRHLLGQPVGRAQPVHPVGQLGGARLGVDGGDRAAAAGHHPTRSLRAPPAGGGWGAANRGALDLAQPTVVGADRAGQVLDDGHQGGEVFASARRSGAHRRANWRSKAAATRGSTSARSAGSSYQTDTRSRIGLPDQLRGNGFGVLGLVQAIGDLGASLVVGVLWAMVSPTLAFTYAAAWMLASLLASGLLRPRGPRTTADPPTG
jgi:hypothetical protein